MYNHPDAFNVARVHDGTFEEHDFCEVAFEQRFEFQLRSFAASNTATQDSVLT